MTDYTRKHQIKSRLRKTWNIFFSQFGRLTLVQEHAIPPILDGKNVMVISATASGKTEAVIAPIVERILKEGFSGISILYITPTRALVNDIYERLKDQMEYLSLTIDKKTGDSPSLNWKNPPNMLITTPESLDSMLCRHREELKTIRYVILDEIHVLDGNYRGDQMRILLRRLRDLSPLFSCYMLSATVKNPNEVASRYHPNIDVVEVSGQRTIQDSYVADLKGAYTISKQERIHKILIFCNRRRVAEGTAIDAKKLWGAQHVVVHHGSLHKHEREESEYVMKHSTRAICVSTMTLEIGIDIGSIDAVILAEIPHTIASLIQRIGRAGRRTGIIRVIGIGNEEDQDLLREMIQLARQNLLDPRIYNPDMSVVIQQLFSMLCHRKAGINYDEFWNYVHDFFLDSSELSEHILPHLEELEFIEMRGMTIFPSEKLMNMAFRGKVHSNIPDMRSYSVKNVQTNHLIGEIELPETTKEHTAFVLAGKVWEVLKIEKSTIIVRPTTRDALPATFRLAYEFGAFFHLLPEHLQDRQIERRSGIPPF